MKWRAVGCILILFFSNCKNPEQEAQAIYRQAQLLDASGRELDALKTYDGLAAYEKTAVYQRAKNELAQRGYTLGQSLSSWTAKKMIDLENQILRAYQATRQWPSTDRLKIPEDAWGRPMAVTYEPKAGVLFQIYSPGPDGLNKTSDDILLGYREQYKFETETERRMSLEEMRRQNVASSDQTSPKGDTGRGSTEQRMDLGEMLKQENKQ